jgi:hemerythrin superfamily protein
MANTRTSTRASSAKQPEAIQMLIADHREVEKLYKQFEKLGEQAEDEKEGIISHVCASLLAHAQLEEEIFYPAVKDQIKDGELIDEAEVEHQSLKDLIAKLLEGDLDTEKRDATFKVLCEYVMHHVQEEEHELFPQLSKSKEIDFEALGEEMAELRMGLDEEAEEVEQDLDAKLESKTGVKARKQN